MTTKEEHIYQFKIILQGSQPPIWRRIQVPGEYTFWDLHVAIQNSMGWEDCHLHSFEMADAGTGRKIVFSDEHEDEDFMISKEMEVPPDFLKHIPILRSENDACLSSYFSLSNKKATYEYDFGDGWRHKIILEKILTFEPGIMYPRCLAGKRACPPEDCGGIWGYEELLEIIKNPSCDEYKERLEWLGDDFDPESFDPTAVRFSNHKERLKITA